MRSAMPSSGRSAQKRSTMTARSSGVELPEAAEDRVAVDQCLKRVAPAGSTAALDRDEPDDSPASQPVPAVVDEDPVEPGAESISLPEAVEGLPRDGKRVLHRILGLVAVAEDQAGEAIGAVQGGSSLGEKARSPLGIGWRAASGVLDNVERFVIHGWREGSHVAGPDESHPRKVLGRP